jgi:hypothetical protein
MTKETKNREDKTIKKPKPFKQQKRKGRWGTFSS